MNRYTHIMVTILIITISLVSFIILLILSLGNYAYSYIHAIAITGAVHSIFPYLLNSHLYKQNITNKCRGFTFFIAPAIMGIITGLSLKTNFFVDDERIIYAFLLYPLTYFTCAYALGFSVYAFIRKKRCKNDE